MNDKKVIAAAKKAVKAYRAWQEEDGILGHAFDPLCEQMDELEKALELPHLFKEQPCKPSDT